MLADAATQLSETISCIAARIAAVGAFRSKLDRGYDRVPGLFRLSLHPRDWIGLKAGADNKGGFRPFSASANRTFRKVGNRHSRNLVSGVFSALPQFGFEPGSVIGQNRSLRH